MSSPALERKRPDKRPEKILDGRRVSETLLSQVREKLARLKQQGQKPPKLVVVRVGENPASVVYTRKKDTIARDLGMASDLLAFPANVSQIELLATLDRLNRDPDVHAVLVQLPLPAGLDSQKILAAVSPQKDVDGFHPENLGRLIAGPLPPALPCTPAGILALLKAYDVPLEGQHAVVVGRSVIVGQPVGLLLLRENATVTFCHSRTRDLAAITRQADILVVAIGQPGRITAEYVKPGAVVVDVGINRQPNGKLVGDVAFEGVCEQASRITPVPGGVGPMTIAMLMANTLALYEASTTL